MSVTSVAVPTIVSGPELWQMSMMVIYRDSQTCITNLLSNMFLFQLALVYILYSILIPGTLDKDLS